MPRGVSMTITSLEPLYDKSLEDFYAIGDDEIPF